MPPFGQVPVPEKSGESLFEFGEVRFPFGTRPRADGQVKARNFLKYWLLRSRRQHRAPPANGWQFLKPV